jgi:hypothetical protein
MIYTQYSSWAIHTPFIIAPFVIAPFVISPYVIASPAGAKQSSDTLAKIALSGKERPPRNDKSFLILSMLLLSLRAPQGRSNLLTR